MIYINLLGGDQIKSNLRFKKERGKLWYKRYYEANKEKYIARANAWRLNNREAVKHAQRINKAAKIADLKKNNPEKMLDYEIADIARKYGISKDEYKRLLCSQNGLCAVCGQSQQGTGSRKRLHLDHDHKFGAVRGFLCQSCNHAIGCAKDDPVLLRKMAEYLENCELKTRE